MKKPNPAKKASAIRYLQQGNPARAARILEGLYRNGQFDAELLFLLGTLKGQQGNNVQAADLLSQSVQLEPRNPNAHFNLGNALHQTGHFTEALQSLNQALQRDPRFVDALVTKAAVLDDLGRHAQALQALDQAQAMAPGMAEIPANRARILDNLGQRVQASQAYRHALELAPGNPELLSLYGYFFSRIGEPEAVLEPVRRFRQAHGDHPLVDCAEATALEKMGDVAAAAHCLQPWLAQTPALPLVWLLYARLCHLQGDCSTTIRTLEFLLQSGDVAPDMLINIHFELGRLQEAQGAYTRAWEHIATSNRLKRIDGGYDPSARQRQVDQIVQNYADIPLSAEAETEIEPRPLFIVGMPRSGTSLLEQILASHGSVAAGGERFEIDAIQAMLAERWNSDPTRLSDSDWTQLREQYISSLPGELRTAACFTDKYPANFQHLGLIRRLLPGARLIHIHRNPLDTCLSCHFQNFSLDYQYATDLEWLADYYLNYRRLMDFWRVTLGDALFEVNYEELVTNPEASLRPLFDYLGLEWEPGCLDFHRKEIRTNTASYRQVREPVHTRSIGRYRHYREQLAPLQQLLTHV